MSAPNPSSLRRNRRGTAAIEFGFTAPMIIMALVGCIELGRAFWIRTALQFAAEETVRYAMVNTDADDATLTAHAQQRLFGLDGDEATFSVSRETVGGADFVEVRGDYPFEFIANLIPMAATTLTGVARASQAE
jgi:Flp pilus assembly protein TadG